MADWFPEAIRDLGNDAGEYTDRGEPKGLLHTTEGKSYAGARQAYVINNSWPHATCTYESGTFIIYQHNPLSKPSRALKNVSGGVETNRDNVIQLEIVGTADRHNASTWGPQYVENFPTPYLDGIARWMRFVNQNHKVPNRCSVIFKKYPESYGKNGVRLTGGQWDTYTGWLGHQHAPENTHGDPGLINMPYLLAQAAGEQPEDDLPYTEAQLNEMMRDAVADEMATPGSRTRAALEELLRGSIASEAGKLNQALDLWAKGAGLLVKDPQNDPDG